jgi:hypothetical protein
VAAGLVQTVATELLVLAAPQVKRKFTVELPVVFHREVLEIVVMLISLVLPFNLFILAATENILHIVMQDRAAALLEFQPLLELFLAAKRLVCLVVAQGAATVLLEHVVAVAVAL